MVPLSRLGRCHAGRRVHREAAPAARRSHHARASKRRLFLPVMIVEERAFKVWGDIITRSIRML
jgi:hypothetical protein